MACRCRHAGSGEKEYVELESRLKSIEWRAPRNDGKLSYATRNAGLDVFKKLNLRSEIWEVANIGQAVMVTGISAYKSPRKSVRANNLVCVSSGIHVSTSRQNDHFQGTEDYGKEQLDSWQ